MHRIVSLCLGLIMLVGLSGALRAEEPAVDPAPWQAVITGQLEAFRAGKSVEALSFAGEAFRMQFRNPDNFIGMVIRTGYGPLVASTSHSFGPFEEARPGVIAQTVLVVGPDQKRYEAVYFLSEEQQGWRIQGVTLGAAAGLSV